MIVRAVRRGQLLRDLSTDGEAAGLLLELAMKLGGLGLARFGKGRAVGIVSVDTEPWAGQRVLYREKLGDAHPGTRLEALKEQVESGALPLPQPLDWRFRRKPPKA